MKDKSLSLGSLDKRLKKASKLLDRCAQEIAMLKFSPRKNIEKIGIALGSIFDVQLQIYKRQPQLRPKFLNKNEDRK